MSDSYPVGKENEVRQLREHAEYDRRTVHRILDSALVANVGFVLDSDPVVVPMIFGRDGETLFLHGARKARIIRLLEQTDRACVSVTRVDGLVFARSAFNSSLNYRSATIFGTPSFVDEREKKLHALRVISEHTMPGRWGELRDPLERELEMTGVISLEIESASAKVSNGMPDDEDEDYGISIWAGVLPLESRLTTVETDPSVPDDILPSEAILSMQNRAR
jgi:nitroimidazol reductase NimA-like FMN-containing flavoprotein (pyridoxamine 5'-phosphate oxidase superfamily)